MAFDPSNPLARQAGEVHPITLPWEEVGKDDALLLVFEYVFTKEQRERLQEWAQDALKGPGPRVLIVELDPRVFIVRDARHRRADVNEHAELSVGTAPRFIE